MLDWLTSDALPRGLSDRPFLSPEIPVRWRELPASPLRGVIVIVSLRLPRWRFR